MLKIDAAQRRARLAVRHHLTPDARADDVTGLVGDMVALHATDPASVHLAAAARLARPGIADVETALYEQRSLIRMLAMRRTMFVVPTAEMEVMDAACGRDVARRERRTLTRTLAEAGVAGDVAAWLAPVERDTLEALRARGEASGRQLSEDVPALRTRFTYGKGKKYGSTQTITTRLLNVLAAEGRIVRGRPSGTWASGQYMWSAMDAWLPGPRTRVLPAEEARARLVRAWLRVFGPATVADIKWWTGLNLGQVRTALAAVEPVDVDLDGEPGVVLADDLEPVPAPGPWVALLPALDPTSMGWTGRDWYLSDDARRRLFDRSGNIGPTVWCGGRVVGGWAQRRSGPADGEIVYELFEDVGRDLDAAVEAAAARLTDLHGEVRVTPRFRTPLERELSA